MIKLETEFVSGVGGFSATPLTYKQVVRNDSFAVYERSYAGRIKDYETIIIKVNPKGFQIFDGKPLEDDTEVYPSTGQFGFKAWSYGNKGAAIHRFIELTNESVKPEDDGNEVEPVGDAPVTDAVVTGHRGRKPKERHELQIPVGEFSIKEMNELNQSEYQDSLFFINEQITKGTIKYLRDERRNAKGKPSRIFAKV